MEKNKKAKYDPRAWESRDLDELYEDVGWSDNRLNMIKMVIDCVPNRLLDIACLDGAYIRKLRELNYKNEYVGIDITKSHIKKAKEKTKPPEDFRTGDARSLSFEDNSFDTVMISDVIQHLPNPRPPLEEACRVSSKWVLVSVYGSDTETYTHHNGGHLNTRYTKEDFLKFIPKDWSVVYFQAFKHPVPKDSKPSDKLLFHFKLLSFKQ